MQLKYQDIIDHAVLSGRKNETSFPQIDAAGRAEFNEQLQFTREVASAIESRESKLIRMRAWETMERRRRTRNAWIYSTSIAASFVAGLFLFTPIGAPAPASIDGYAVCQRGTLPLSRIADEMQAGHYQDALVNIDSVTSLEAASSDVSRDRYAVCKESDKSDEIDSYEAAMQDLHRHEIQWMKANALLGAGEIRQACKAFKVIMNGDGPYKEQARKYYRQLRFRIEF